MNDSDNLVQLLLYYKINWKIFSDMTRSIAGNHSGNLNSTNVPPGSYSHPGLDSNSSYQHSSSMPMSREVTFLQQQVTKFCRNAQILIAKLRWFIG